METVFRLPFMCKADAVADLDGGNTLPTTPSGDQACEGYEGNWYEDSTTGMCYQVSVTAGIMTV